jgi:hypothetical protein
MKMAEPPKLLQTNNLIPNGGTSKMKKMIAICVMLSMLVFSVNAFADANATAGAGAYAGSAVNGDIGSNNISNDMRGFTVPGTAQ